MMFLYKKTNVKAEKHINSNEVSSYSSDEIIEIASNFKRQLEEMPIPFSDLYIQIPCHIENRINDKINIEVTDFINEMNLTSKNEFSDLFSNDLTRIYLERVYITINKLNVEQIADVYLTTHKSTNLSVLTFMIPAIAVDTIKLLQDLIGNKILIRKESDKKGIPIENWLSQFSIKIYGSPRAIMFTPLKPKTKELYSLLACEEVPKEYNITSDQFIKFAENNLGQYDSSEIYASENFLIVIQQNFNDNFKDRISRQSLTLFISEAIQLQDAAVSKLDFLISDEIYKSVNKNHKSNSLDMLEKMVSESCKSIMLWNIRNFKYGTSRYLADNISKAFGIERILENQNSNKMRLEQLIHIHNVNINELENKNINRLLLLLAMLQVIPTLYSMCLAFFNNELNLQNYISAVSSMAICFVLWFIFNIRTSIEKRRKNMIDISFNTDNKK